MPPVFPWLARTGNVAGEEMLRVFNCGVGMALIVADAEAAMALLRDAGETPFLLGAITASAGIEIPGAKTLFA
jgi:phosphoribosylformylglycinamidine cyclo-ligase